jgi:hypothetical protein
LYPWIGVWDGLGGTGISFAAPGPFLWGGVRLEVVEHFLESCRCVVLVEICVLGRDKS